MLCKGSSLNAPGTETPLSQCFLDLLVCSRWRCHVDFSMYNALSAGGYLTKKIGRAPIPHVACTKNVHRPRRTPDPPLCASLEKGRNGEFFVLRVTTHLNSSRHRPRSSWGKESQAFNACKQLARPRISSGRERGDTCPPH